VNKVPGTGAITSKLSEAGGYLIPGSLEVKVPVSHSGQYLQFLRSAPAGAVLVMWSAVAGM